MMTLPRSAEFAAAVARLDADLRIAAPDLQMLRRHAVGAYRSALDGAAGSAFDPHWTALALAVASFIANIPAGPRTAAADAAVARLRLF